MNTTKVFWFMDASEISRSFCPLDGCLNRFHGKGMGEETPLHFHSKIDQVRKAAKTKEEE
jgi:hypothetical protein